MQASIAIDPTDTTGEEDNSGVRVDTGGTLHSSHTHSHQNNINQSKSTNENDLAGDNSTWK
jgi:hypothetical protein